MPINRAPFNALIDDDGTNTTGTPWNKAAIAGVILDPVDAALAALPLGTWVAEPFSAAKFSATGGTGATWAVGAPAVVLNRYTIIGTTMIWSLYLSWFSGSNVVAGGPTGLVITVPGGRTARGGGVILAADYTVDTGGGRIAADIAPAGPSVTISKTSGAAWANGALGLITTLTFELG
jgi:hypothetical protein